MKIYLMALLQVLTGNAPLQTLKEASLQTVKKCLNLLKGISSSRYLEYPTAGERAVEQLKNSPYPYIYLQKEEDDPDSERLGDADAKKLAEVLKTNRFLTAIHLEGNNIGPAGAEAFGQALENNPYVVEITGVPMTPTLQSRLERNQRILKTFKEKEEAVEKHLRDPKVHTPLDEALLLKAQTSFARNLFMAYSAANIQRKKAEGPLSTDLSSLPIEIIWKCSQYGPATPPLFHRIVEKEFESEKTKKELECWELIPVDMGSSQIIANEKEAQTTMKSRAEIRTPRASSSQ